MHTSYVITRTKNPVLDSPVMNLRDKLVISICDSEDHSVTQTGRASVYLRCSIHDSQYCQCDLEVAWRAGCFSSV